MNKVLSSLILISTLAYGTYTKQDRIHDMHDMANAMNLIQSGFFYNNYDTISQGVESLSDAIERVRPPLEEVEETDMMARYMNNKTRMTRKVVKKINQKGLTILQRYKNGDSTQAVQAYTKILGQCMKCHRETRNW
ncbi:cytochrome C [Sulfurimonas sp. SAG-AH-194-I05]|nr:cytochrome C [Sulfurimonas sp. SAG-AH-194-I05]